MRDQIRGATLRQTGLGVLALVLTGCGPMLVNRPEKTPEVDSSGVTLVQGTADGTGVSELASASDTSVTVTPSSGSAWNSFLIDLGSHFLADNICTGKTIFGRLGSAACMALVDNRFNDVGSATKRIISKTGYDDDGYYRKRDTAGYINGTETILKPDVTGVAACGEAGTITERIEECNYTWNATGTVSNSGHGSWSLVTKTTTNGYQVWRDDRTGLIWGDNMGDESQCIASGNVENFDQAAATAAWGAAPSGTWHANMLSNCAAQNPDPDAGGPYVGTSWCAEDATLDTPASLDEFKGGMRAADGVEWRLPTREDYFMAYANGMGYVLPNFLNNYFWTASVNSNNRGNAWFFNANVYGVVGVANGDRGSDSQVRCVGR